MAFVFSLLMSGYILYGLYRFVRSPQVRRDFFTQTLNDPLNSAFVAVWAACWMAFFRGVFVPPFGMLPLIGMRVWQVAGIGSLIGLVLQFSVKRLN